MKELLCRTTLMGEQLEFPRSGGLLDPFLAMVEQAAADPRITEDGIKCLVWGQDNPLLNTTILPGRALATRETYEHPAFRVMLDCIDRKRVAVGTLDIDRAAAKYTMTVQDAATKLKLHEATIRTAIRSGRLSAWQRGGTYYLDPASVAGYQVSIRGAKAVPHLGEYTPGPKDGAPYEEDPLQDPLDLRMGAQGDFFLQAKWKGGLKDLRKEQDGSLSGKVLSGWKRVAVLTGSKGSGNYRLYILVPKKKVDDPWKIPELKFVGFHVRGQFKVDGKPITNPRKATEAWEAFQAE